MKYKANCHCKAIEFEFESKPIKSALQCNCSICIRKNALMSVEYIEPEHFRLIKGADFLSVYQWNDKDVNHCYCSKCGIYTFHDSIYQPGKYRINLGCVVGLNPRNLEIIEFDGRNEI